MQIGGFSSQAMSASALAQTHSKIFSKLDNNSDEALSLEELKSGQSASKNGSSSSTQSVEERFKNMDTDGNGSVTKEEGLAFFKAAMSSDTMGGLLSAQSQDTAQGADRGHQPPAFSDIDSDSDGSITKSEMQNFSSTVMNDSDTSKADAIFDKMDTNKDGSVSAQEKSSFDSQMQANGPKGPPPGGPPSSQSDKNDDSSSANATTTSSSDLTANVQSLMKELLAALQASSGLYSASTDNSSSISATA